MDEKYPRIRIAVVLLKEDNILLVKHHKHGQTYWLLPGGGLEFGETIAQCARRELLEETGLEIALGKLFHISESIPPDRHRHVVNLYFDGRVIGGKLRPAEDEEVLVDAEYRPVSELTQLDFRPPIAREIVRHILEPEKVEHISLGNRWE